MMFSAKWEETAMRNPYTIKDAGCYVDSARGIYTVDAIYAFAEKHGFVLGTDGEPELVVLLDKGKLHEYEFSNDVEDEIDSFMNEQFPVDSASWGRNENGDWGLWTNEEDEQE
jgi:hypothetical protein